MIHTFAGRLRQVVPLVLTVLVLVAGCQYPQQFLPEPLPGIVKVGLVAPFEGSYRYVGYDAVYAARLAVREINAAGGMDGGWRLELVAYDDRGEADLAVQIAGNLVIDPDVIAVIGHYRPGTSMSAGTVYADAALPHIVIGDAIVPSSTAWHLSPPPARVAEAMARVGLASNPETTTVWVDARAPSGSVDPLRTYLTDHALTPVENDDVELVFSYVGPVDAASRLVGMRSEGWPGQLVGNEQLAAAAFGAAGGDAVAGAQFLSPYPLPEDLADTQDWIGAYRAMGPHVPNPGPYAMPTYEAVYLLAEALSTILKDAAPPARGALGQALGNPVYSGRLGELRWTPDHYWASMPLYHYLWIQDRSQLVQVIP